MTLREALEATKDNCRSPRKGGEGTTVFITFRVHDRLREMAKALAVTQGHLAEAVFLMALTKFEGKRVVPFQKGGK